jgi:hypothetical protein
MLAGDLEGRLFLKHPHAGTCTEKRGGFESRPRANRVRILDVRILKGESKTSDK